MKEPVGILVGPKGRGSNMTALGRACKIPGFPATVVNVIAPKPDIPAIFAAHSLGLNVSVVPPGEEYGARLLEALAGCAWLCLAGFTRLVPTEVLQQFPNRVLNIHPALLPKFGGRGMYGRHVHEAVLAAAESESGCTVHLVNDAYDEGRILLQKRCPVLAGDTPDSLAARVLALEHQAFPEALAEAILAARS